MFICHKCGYKEFSSREKTSCPVCGANILVPNFAMILFLSLLSFIIFTVLSVFEDKLHILSAIFLIIAAVSLPCAIIEAFERNNEVQDGFRAPDYPNEIINGNPRVPDFKAYDYVYGLKDAEDVKKILLEPYKDGLNYYCKKLRETQKINYSEILGIELYEENELRLSAAKSIFYGALLGAAGGIAAGMAGGIIGGMDNKNRYFLGIRFKEQNEEKCLYITSGKNELINLAKKIEHYTFEE